MTKAIDPDKYIGAMLGLLLGDAYCAEYEGGILERLLWKIIGKKNGRLRYTDDSEMNLVIGKNFIENNGIDIRKLAMEFALEYKWSRGYGQSTAYVLKKIRSGVPYDVAAIMKYKNGSFGNGAAMRAPIVAVCYSNCSKNEIFDILDKVSSITHPNSRALDGARLIANCVLRGLENQDNDDIIEESLKLIKDEEISDKLIKIKEDLQAEYKHKSAYLAGKYGNGTSAFNSCPLSVYMALKYRKSELKELLNAVIECGGDTDTIGAMAGAIWGAINGRAKINQDLFSHVEGAEEMIRLTNEIIHKSAQQTNTPDSVSLG